MKRFPKEVKTAIVEFMRDCMTDDFDYIDWPLDEVDFHDYEDLKYINKLWNDDDETYDLHYSNPYDHYKAYANCATYDKKTNTLTFNFADFEDSYDLVEYTELNEDELVKYFNQNHNIKNNININWVNDISKKIC